MVSSGRVFVPQARICPGGPFGVLLYNFVGIYLRSFVPHSINIQVGTMAAWLVVGHPQKQNQNPRPISEPNSALGQVMA